MAKNILTLLSGILMNTATVSGQIEKIDTDRPDQTESVFTVPKGYFQAELGFTKEYSKGKNFDLTHPVALLKYGLKKFEFRVETVLHSSYTQMVPGSKWIGGLDPVEVGFKVQLFDEKKILPKTSLITHIGIPGLASKQFKSNHLAPSFVFTMQNSLTNKINLGYNAGIRWGGFTSTPLWLYTLANGYDLGDKWYAYAEVFGIFQKNELPQHSIDGGIAYYINPDMKVDISAGAGISSTAPKKYFALGFSFRIKTNPLSKY